MDIWDILGIEATKDKKALKIAYMTKLSVTNPEENPEGFMELRNAYEAALKYSDMKDDENEEEVDNSPMGLWMSRVKDAYFDLAKRRDIEVWKDILNDEICIGLMTKTEARNQLLRFIMDYYTFPQKVWQLFDEVFDLIYDADELYEIFPKDFIDYAVINGIRNEDVIDFEAFDIEEGKNYEEFIDRYLKLRKDVNSSNLDNVEKDIEEVEETGIDYPYVKFEIGKYLIRSEKYEEAREELLKIDMEKVDKSDLTYLIGVTYSASQDFENALVYYEKILNEYDKNSIRAKSGKAYCFQMMERYEESRDLWADVLNEEPQNQSADNNYNEVTKKLIPIYEGRIADGLDINTNRIELAWCRLHNKEYELSLETLKDVETDDKNIYRYYNTKSHDYAILERFDEAIESFTQWMKLLEKLKDDDSEEAKKHYSRYAYVIFRIGCCYQGKDDYEKAFEYIEKAMEVDPADKGFYLTKADLLYKKERYDEALSICNTLIREDINNGDAYGLRLRIYFEMGNLQESIEDCDRCIDCSPYYLQAYLYKVRVLFAYDEFEEGKKILDFLKESGAEYIDIDILFGLYDLERPDSTDEDIQKVKEAFNSLVLKLKNKEIESSKLTSRLYVIMANWCIDSKIDEACEYADEALKIKPNDVDAIYIKAKYYTDKKMNKEAIEALKLVTQRRPRHNFAFGRLGDIYYNLKKIDEAIECYNHQLEINPSCYYYVSRALCYFDRDNYKEAIEDNLKAIDMDSTDPYVYNNLGLCYFEMGDYDKAVELYAKSIGNLGKYNFSTVYRNMVKVLRRRKEFKLAIKYATEWVNKFDEVRAYEILGEVYTEDGDVENAIKAYDNWRIKSKLPKTDAAYLTDIGDLYIHVNDFSTAKKYLKKGYDSDFAKKLLGIIYTCEKKYKKARICFVDRPDCTDKFLFLADNSRRLNNRQDKINYAKEGLKRIIDGNLYDTNEKTDEIYRIGAFYFFMEDYDKAREYFEQALNRQLCNKCVECVCHEASYWAGIFYEDRGELDKALACYKRALLGWKSPEYVFAYNELAKKMGKN